MNYDFSKWHPACGIKDILPTPTGILVVCPKCQIAADLEAISAKITPADACLDDEKAVRVPIGKQSYGVDKGECVL